MKEFAAFWVALYAIGFCAVFVLHLAMLPMVMRDLAALRAAVWPIYLLTGWPHGVPLPMD